MPRSRSHHPNPHGVTAIRAMPCLAAVRPPSKSKIGSAPRCLFNHTEAPGLIGSQPNHVCVSQHHPRSDR